ncbi:hypothetical protein [Aliivibrio fischeri]|uniref:hypothetical protein n=1 Tax=Aliivibrio fischeri TaxID=668 RepID=UPI0012D9BD6F|nr:hypothetical protein [Aliivibrio fischeri]MUJ20462.1 hypothetical protein [Aliivibrio fischeri]
MKSKDKSKPRSAMLSALHSIIDDVSIILLFLALLFLILSRYGYETLDMSVMIGWGACSASVFVALLVRFAFFKIKYDRLFNS